LDMAGPPTVLMAKRLGPIIPACPGKRKGGREPGGTTVFCRCSFGGSAFGWAGGEQADSLRYVARRKYGAKSPWVCTREAPAVG